MEITMPETLYHFVGGKRVAGKSGRTSDVFNPATGEVQAKLPLASVAEVDAAVKDALAAFPGWANTPAPKRATVLFKMRELVIANMDALAERSEEHTSELQSIMRISYAVFC